MSQVRIYAWGYRYHAATSLAEAARHFKADPVTVCDVTEAMEAAAKHLVAAFREMAEAGKVLSDALAAQLAQANTRIAELESQAAETQQRLVWQAEGVAQTLERQTQEPIVVIPHERPAGEKSRFAKLFGDQIVYMHDVEFYSADDIADILNANRPRTDRINVKQVNGVLQEMARIKRAQTEAGAA